ncbi:MAG TPA: substrate-binding domain-containing protein, partial [Acidimicrobiia bacterium]|nr:substrate-binding domain-containing protein [Acidimicrobiia bacterium]
MTTGLLRAIAAIALVFTTIGVGAPAASAAGAPVLGGGSGFAALEIDQWRADTARAPYNLTVNYVAQGSTFGRNQFNTGTFDYAASDIQYPQQEIGQLQSGRCRGKPISDQCFVYVPVSAGGLAFMYNLTDGSGSRVANLRLTRAAVCKIFTGAIRKWNDPEIVAANPSLASYDHNIKAVVRSDGAGESFVLSEYCIAIEHQVWTDFIAQQHGSGPQGDNVPEFAAGQPVSNWPQNGWGSNYNAPSADGTANYVADPVGGPDTITYVAAGYAKVRSFPTASVQNASGFFTQPDEDNVTVALQYASGRPNGTFQLAFNGPDRRAYFPSTYSYVLAQTTGFDPSKGATLTRYLCYAVSKGQAVAPQLRYARLSSQLVTIAISAIVKIPGAPSALSCPVAGAPPPPPPPSVCTSNCGGPGTTVSGPGGPAGPGGPTSGPNAQNPNAKNAMSGSAGSGNCATTTTTTSTSTRATTTTTVCVPTAGSGPGRNG